MSANVGQLGKLISPIVVSNKACVCGQRYGVLGSILVKEEGVLTEPISTGTKPDKLIILFRHFVRATLIPALADVLDTQAGFKAFDAAVLREVLPKVQAFKETFDVELLIHVAQQVGFDSVGTEPILFTEDFALTNFPSVDPSVGHLNMIRQIVEIYEKHVAKFTPACPELLSFFKALDLSQYIRLIEGLRAADANDTTLFERRWTLEQLRIAANS